MDAMAVAVVGVSSFLKGLLMSKAYLLLQEVAGGSEQVHPKMAVMVMQVCLQERDLAMCHQARAF